MNKNTYEDCATNYELWTEYVDPDCTISERVFNRMPIAEKIQIQIECFGEEEEKE